MLANMFRHCDIDLGRGGGRVRSLDNRCRGGPNPPFIVNGNNCIDPTRGLRERPHKYCVTLLGR